MSQKDTGAQVTISQIIDGFRRFNEAQEALRAQELKHWQTERQSFLKRIKELEDAIVTLATSTHGNTTVSSTADPPSQSNQEPSSSTTKARAVWDPESVPTRTFSETAVSQSTSIASQIQKVGDAERKKSVGFDIFSKPSATRHTSLAGVDGELIHPDYSGITVKPSALPLHLRQKVVDSLQKTENIDNARPQAVIRPKLLDIPTANMRSEELYTADVGHTPLARVIGSEGTTGTLTPIAQTSQAPIVEDSSTKPNPRLPSERQDSYFANIQVDGPSDGDPALQEPLGVSADNTTKQDADFLEQVNQSLERQLLQLDDAELSPSADKGHRRNVSEADDGGPKLKLKQSTNFGAPFGQSEPTRT